MGVIGGWHPGGPHEQRHRRGKTMSNYGINCKKWGGMVREDLTCIVQAAGGVRVRCAQQVDNTRANGKDGLAGSAQVEGCCYSSRSREDL